MIKRFNHNDNLHGKGVYYLLVPSELTNNVSTTGEACPVGIPGWRPKWKPMVVNNK